MMDSFLGLVLVRNAVESRLVKSNAVRYLVGITTWALGDENW